jgi:hypothetical protein
VKRRLLSILICLSLCRWYTENAMYTSIANEHRPIPEKMKMKRTGWLTISILYRCSVVEEELVDLGLDWPRVVSIVTSHLHLHLHLLDKPGMFKSRVPRGGNGVARRMSAREAALGRLVRSSESMYSRRWNNDELTVVEQGMRMRLSKKESG